MPYPRLKNSRTCKSQFTVLENRKSKKKWTEWRAGPASASPWRAKRGTLPKLSTFLSQLKGGPFGEKKFSKKVSQCGKTERWDPLGGFSTSILSQNRKKIEGGPFGEKNSEKKAPSAETNWKGDPLVSPGIVCYAEKQEKPFWFSSLCQMVQFGAIIFCRTFKNYFGQFVWIEKSL